MATQNTMTQAQRDQLEKIAKAHGMTPERLITLVMRRQEQDRDAVRTEVVRPLAQQKRRAVRFHIGESMAGHRR